MVRKDDWFLHFLPKKWFVLSRIEQGKWEGGFFKYNLVLEEKRLAFPEVLTERDLGWSQVQLVFELC